MGKGKNKTNQVHEMQEQGGRKSSAENSSEQKKNEEESNKGNKLNPKGVIVLGVFIHCQGCADTIVKCLRGFDGVEVIEIDSKSDKVTVKGAKADPMKVVERIEKKTGKHVELISPVLPKEKKEDKKEDKKQEPKLVEVTLKLHLHCEGCAKDVKHMIYKMQGVQTVEADMKNSMVKVMGTFEAEKMVKFIGKRRGRHAVLVKLEKKEEEGGGGGGGGGKEDENSNQQSEGNHQKGGKRESIYPNYHPDLVYAPQLFSDENPNSCSLM